MTLVRHQILDKMRHDVLSCAFRPGEELREAELAERYNVSKSPVRDALQHLAFEGLVETMPRRGHRVTPVSVSDARDLLEMREALEIAACRRIAEHASGQTLRALDRFRDADTQDPRRVSPATTGGSTSPSASRRATGGWPTPCGGCSTPITGSAWSRWAQVREQEGDMSTPLEDHRAIIDALQARDPRRAAQLVRRHVRKSSNQILKGLENRPIID